MILQLITPTGDRPEAWHLAQRYVERQTIDAKIIWHVVDDGIHPMVMDFNRPGSIMHTYRLPPMQGNSQHRNLKFLLGVVDHDYPVVFWEDDDWYAPTYLEALAPHLKDHEIVGHQVCRKYNLATHRWLELLNPPHASLCATMVRGQALQQACLLVERTHMFIDLSLWRRIRGGMLVKGHHIVGIKRMPGRRGIDSGHRDTMGQPDTSDCSVLRRWLGDDFNLYERFL